MNTNRSTTEIAYIRVDNIGKVRQNGRFSERLHLKLYGWRVSDGILHWIWSSRGSWISDSAKSLVKRETEEYNKILDLGRFNTNINIKTSYF